MAKSKFAGTWLVIGCMMVTVFFISGKSMKHPQSIPAREVKSATKADLFLENVSLIRKIKAQLR